MGGICAPGENHFHTLLFQTDNHDFNTTVVYQKESSNPDRATQSKKMRLSDRMRKASPAQTVGNGMKRKNMAYAAASRLPLASP
jgi:hypothetical protein